MNLWLVYRRLQHVINRIELTWHAIRTTDDHDVPLFDPRSQTMFGVDHFEVDWKQARIIAGLTPIGRATIESSAARIASISSARAGAMSIAAGCASA